MDDVKIGEIFGRLGRIETAMEIQTERLSSLSARLDREILRRLELSENHHEAQDHRIDILESFRDETRGAFTLLRFLVGTSVLTAVLAAISIIVSVSGGHP